MDDKRGGILGRFWKSDEKNVSLGLYPGDPEKGVKLQKKTCNVRRNLKCPKVYLKKKKEKKKK